VGRKDGAATVGSSLAAPQQDPGIPLLGLYTFPQIEKRLRDTGTPIFTIAQRWKQPRCPSVDKWINKYGVCV